MSGHSPIPASFIRLPIVNDPPYFLPKILLVLRFNCDILCCAWFFEAS